VRGGAEASGAGSRGATASAISLGVGLLVLAGLTTPARAEPRKLRMAAIAPEGTEWARHLRQLGRDVDELSEGAVQMKWYLGGIAGDELQALERMQNGQLDGMAGASFCSRVAPSLRVTRILGLLQDREEVRYILRRLAPKVDEELLANHLIGLGLGTFGKDVLMTRFPVTSMAELRRARMWVWELDEVWPKLLPILGVQPVTTSLERANAEYEAGHTDGFIAIPAGALVYQWSTRARYFAELPTAFLPMCMVMTQRAFSSLPFQAQQAVRTAAAKLIPRFDEASRHMEEQLLHGLFEKQGLKRVPVSREFRQAFFEAARAARERSQLVPAPLLQEVLSWLADLRGARAPTLP